MTMDNGQLTIDNGQLTMDNGQLMCRQRRRIVGEAFRLPRDGKPVPYEGGRLYGCRDTRPRVSADTAGAVSLRGDFTLYGCRGGVSPPAGRETRPLRKEFTIFVTEL